MELRELLQTPLIFEQNRMKPHSDHAACFAGEHRPRVLVLDGAWKFHYAPDLVERIEAFERDPALSSGWDSVSVPGHVNFAGYDLPQYTNTAYPWDGKEQLFPPFLPAKIPAGQFIREFDLPEGWQGQKLRIRFEGVEPAFRVWCNGNYVGYSEDSFTPAEFDVTEYARPKANILAVEVYRWASGSWLEDQDFWRLWGIFRSVKLLCLPPCHMEDMKVTADMSGLLQAEITVTGGAERILAELIAPDGRQAAQKWIPVENGRAVVTAQVDAPELWSAEHPNLYLLSLSLKKGGVIVETSTQPVGFRSFYIENGIMKLNGKRLIFHGVNRHEWSAEKGRVVALAEMERDVLLMKRNNINAVRTSHYPNCSEWYELCDRIGLYVVDEVNLETHGTWSRMPQKEECRLPVLPDGNPDWKAAVFARAESMYERDKNHPSILIWSCGNESAGGETLYEMSNLLRRWDSTRPIHYEGVTLDPRFPDTSDIYSTMYYPAKQVESILKDGLTRPFVQIEYAHAMGNSCGALECYIELEDCYEQYQGGFVWDWIDQQIKAENRLQYGGDFRDRPSNGDFCANGLLFADGTPSPKLPAVKAAYEPCKITLTKDGVELQNKLLFTDLSEFDLKLSVRTVEGAAFSNVLTVPCAPLEKTVFHYKPPVPVGCETWLRASLCLKKDTLWAAAGHEIARAERTLCSCAEAQSKWRLVDGTEHLGFYSSKFSVLFDKASGHLCSINCNGREWLSAPPRPVFWRAPVSNDRGSEWPYEKSMWKGADLYQKLESFRLNESGPYYEVNAVYLLPTNPQIPCVLRYRFEPEENMRVTLYCNLPNGMEPPFVFGLQLISFKENAEIEYNGLGPMETAPDRLRGAQRGHWLFDAKQALPPYMKPQSAGLRCETRWFSCGGVTFKGMAAFALSALPWTQHELESASHYYDLPPSEKVVLQLLSDACGVAGDDTWGARPHKAFRLEKNAFYLEFTVSVST